LKKNQYSNVFTQDLFDAIGAYAKVSDLASLMHNWTHTAGSFITKHNHSFDIFLLTLLRIRYPLVTIEKASKGDNKFIAKQSRYFAYNGESSFNSQVASNNQTWWIPLTILLPNGDIMDLPFDVAIVKHL